MTSEVISEGFLVNIIIAKQLKPLKIVEHTAHASASHPVKFVGANGYIRQWSSSMSMINKKKKNKPSAVHEITCM